MMPSSFEIRDDSGNARKSAADMIADGWHVAEESKDGAYVKLTKSRVFRVKRPATAPKIEQK